MQPDNYYKERITQLQQKLQQLQKKNSLLGWSRLISSVAIIPILYLVWPYGWLYLVPVAILLLIIFIRLIFIDLDNKVAIRHQQQLININEDELNALDGEYLHFDDGAIHSPHEHLYSNDLDIFGKASLYQYINRSTSAMGASTLAIWLLNPATEEIIEARQTAAKELNSQTEWRQALQAFGKEKKN